MAVAGSSRTPDASEEEWIPVSNGPVQCHVEVLHHAHNDAPARSTVSRLVIGRAREVRPPKYRV